VRDKVYTMQEVLNGLYNKFKLRERVLHIKYMKEREFPLEMRGHDSLTLCTERVYRMRH